MNLKTATIIAILLCVLVIVSLTVLKIYVWPTIGWDIMFLAIGVCVSIILGGFNMFSLFRTDMTAREANRLSERALMPDIEFKYELRELESDYKDKRSYYNYIEGDLSKYGRKYHHLILFNGGNGKAEGWVDAYNWKPFDGKPDGFDYEQLPPGVILIHTNYLFPGKENIQIPAIIAQNDIYEDAKWLLIRIKYSDQLGNKHCQCKQFFRKKEERGFVQDSQKARYNIFHVHLPESEDNCKKCQDCFFDEKLIARGRAK